MFEGKPPKAEGASPFGAEPPEAGLRPLSWEELVSRLSAAKDQRRADPPEVGGHSDASFHSGSAQRLAARHDGKDGINLEDSGNLKVTGRTVGTGSNMHSATRGNT